VVEASEVLIPQYEADLTIQERNHAIAQGSRQAGYIVAGLMTLMFIVVMHVDNFRIAYSRPARPGDPPGHRGHGHADLLDHRPDHPEACGGVRWKPGGDQDAAGAPLCLRVPK